MVPSTWPKAMLIEPKAALGAQRGLGELPLFRVEHEQIGDRPGQRHAAVENSARVRRCSCSSKLMAVFDCAVQPLRQVPGPHQPAADSGMIGLQAFLFVFGERRVIALQFFSVAIQIGHGLIERQHADILQQRREEDFFGQRLAHGVAERARRGCRQQCAAPVKFVVQAVRLGAAQAI